MRCDGDLQMSLLPATTTECCICLEELSDLPYIKCSECEKCDVFLCCKCFKLGAESGEHLRGHNYQIINKTGPEVFENDSDSNSNWGCFEDLGLLTSFMNGHLDQWPDISKEYGQGRSVDDALDRIDRFFLRSKIGDYILKIIKQTPLKLAIDESCNESVAGVLSQQIYNRSFKLKNNDFSSILNTDSFTTPLRAKNSISCRSPISIKTDDYSSFERLSSTTSDCDRLLSQHSPTLSPISSKKQSISPNKLSSPISRYGNSRRKSNNMESNGCASSTRLSLKLNNKSLNNSPAKSARQPLLPPDFTMEEHNDSDSGSSAIADLPEFNTNTKRRRSIRSGISSKFETPSTPTSVQMKFEMDSTTLSRRNSIEFRANRREMLENAKNEASEALRGKMSERVRKSSLELHEALNISEEAANPNIMSEDTIRELREKYADSYFYAHQPNKMSREAINKFDAEDLQLIGYMPYRDDFEHEYKNEAEQLISRINFRHAHPSDEVNEVEKFLDAVRFARIQRYNRILKTRIAKRGAIVEHDLLNEYLSIAKNNLSEKGKYNVFADKYFNSKRKEEDYKPLFCQIRQVANRNTVETLAKSIGKMETLIDQIEELQQLHKNGVKVLKGKLKVDTLPPSWSKRKRNRRVDNVETRKANLRWKRIIRWSKKQSSETDE